MARTPSTMLALGTPAADFALPDAVSGRTVRLADMADAAALTVMFICNHCPFVIHVRDELTRVAHDYLPRGVAFVAISSNDVAAYPQDGPGPMAELSRAMGWSFPYLFDASQAVARAYRAACTPDLYVFDRDRRLAYRGQLDDSRPDSGIPVTGRDLRGALDAVLAGRAVPGPQKPSLGCNIKWRPGNEPDYVTSPRR